FWIYFVFLMLTFAVFQQVIRAGGGKGLEFPIMFQLVVIFHYWSWYVFSFDKLHALSSAASNQAKVTTVAQKTLYDRMMGSFRTVPRFAALVLILNLVSAAGVLWYSKWHGPASLRFAFDYSYFLYFLVLHVTFSFAPRRPANVRQTSVCR